MYWQKGYHQWKHIVQPSGKVFLHSSKRKDRQSTYEHVEQTCCKEVVLYKHEQKTQKACKHSIRLVCRKTKILSKTHPIPSSLRHHVAQTLRSSIQSLNDQIGQAALEGSEDFARLGISVRDSNGQMKDAQQILVEVRKRFAEMDLSLQEAQTLAQSIGIDQSLVRMLRLSGEEFRAMTGRAREYGEITAEHTETTHKYNNAIKEMKFGFDTIKTLIAVGLAPMMQHLSDLMGSLLIKHKDLIVGGVKWLGEWLGNIAGALKRLAPVIGVAIGLFAAWKVVTLGLGGALQFALSPVTLIVAGIAGLLLIIDDLIVAFRGGQSVIASFFKEFLGVDIQPILQGIVDAFWSMMGALKSIWDNGIGFIANVFRGLFDLLTGDFSGLVENFAAAGRNIIAAAKSIVGGVYDAFKSILSGIWEGLPDNAKKAFLKMKEKVMGILNTLLEPIRTVGSWMGFGGGTGQQPPQQQRIGAGGMVSQQTRQDARSVQQNNEINIQTDNPEQAGRSVDRNLRRQMRDANQHLRGGIGP